MRKPSIQQNFNSFYEWMNYYEDFLQTILDTETLTIKSKTDRWNEKLGNNEKIEIFEAFIFKIDATWQSFVRSLFVDCLNKDLTKYSNSTFSDLPKHLPWQVCRAMVNGLNYFDFRTIEELKKIGKKYLVDKYNPFKEIPNDIGRQIDDFFTIRNFVTHQSHFSLNKLRLMYKNKYNLKRYKKPGIFLMTFNKKLDNLQFGIYMDCMEKAAKRMKNFLKNK